MERMSMEWKETVTGEQRKYLYLRAFRLAAVFFMAAVVLEIAAAYMAVPAENGWLYLVLAALAGGYFPGFLGGIRKLYIKGTGLPETKEAESMCSRRIIPFQKYAALKQPLR